MAKLIPDVKQQHEVDPAAEFLAQQQNEIAEINAAGSCEKDEHSPCQSDKDRGPSPEAATEAKLKKPRIEPEKMQRWREQNKKLLANKDRDAKRMQNEWSSEARKQLEDWDKKRTEWLQKVKKDNRIAQREFIKDRDYVTPGSEWERVAAMCDFTPKGVKGIKKDLSRMRSTLLNLKKNPRAISPTRSSSTSPRLSPNSLKRNKER